MCAHIPFPLYLLSSVSSTHTGFRLDPKYTIAEQVVIFSKLDCCYWCHLGASVLDIPLSGVPVYLSLHLLEGHLGYFQVWWVNYE